MFRNNFTYRVKYTQENFNHYRPDLRRPKHTSELIITNGFKVYGLIKNYTEIIKEDEYSRALFSSALKSQIENSKEE